MNNVTLTKQLQNNYYSILNNDKYVYKYFKDKIKPLGDVTSQASSSVVSASLDTSAPRELVVLNLRGLFLCLYFHVLLP